MAEPFHQDKQFPIFVAF